MSNAEYNTVRSLKLHQVKNNPKLKSLLRRYALEFCYGPVQIAFLKLATE